jgi:hypothetical protein
MFLMHENKSDYPQFSAGDFWEDMQQWLFTGDRVESSFWQHVSNPAPQTAAAQGEVSTELTNNLQGQS